MVLVRILERKDAASLIAAIAAGLIVGQFIYFLANRLSAWIVGVNDLSMKTDILQPILGFFLALILLEGLARLAVATRGEMVRRRP